MIEGRRFNLAVAQERGPLQDHCGIVGAFSPHDFTFYSRGVKGLDQLQTRGHDGAGGFAMSLDGNVVLNHKGEGRVLKVFDDSFSQENRLIPAQTWIFQTRYGTNGNPNTPEASIQPLVRPHAATGDVFAVAHNGEFESEDRNGPVSDSVRFAERLAQSEGDTWQDRITNTVVGEKGAYSLIIGTPDGMFLIRDPKGIRPLSYGRYWDDNSGDNVWIAASETNALSVMGAVDLAEVLPGQLVHFTKDNDPKIVQIQPTEKSEVCIFEDVYTGHGNSKAHLPRTESGEINRSVFTGETRRRSGEIMAKEAPIGSDEVDYVIGIPGTAITGGKGFAKELGLRYQQLITDVDHENNPRSFMMPDVDGIYAKVLEGFNFDKERLLGVRVVLVDDSIVRNNVMRAIVEYLTEKCGVKSVDVRVLCPPIEDVCNRGLNTRTKGELVAGQVRAAFGGDMDDEQLTEVVREKLGVRSLAYLSIEGLKEAQTGDPQDERFCTMCMDKPKSQGLNGHPVSVNVFSRTSKSVVANSVIN